MMNLSLSYYLSLLAVTLLPTAALSQTVASASDRLVMGNSREMSAGVTVGTADGNEHHLSRYASLPGKGSWLRYGRVDFSSLTDAYLTLSVRARDNAALLVREGSATGKVIARVDVVVKGGGGPFRRDYSGQWMSLAVPLLYTPRGVADIVLTCNDKGVDVGWLRFKNRPKYFVPATSVAVRPDAQGYLRRWLLLEPVRQDIRSNVVFTDSYLQKAFSKEYFKGQMTRLPHDGQQVRVGDQKLKWHALDSENYNVRLFRFAERWGQQTYGSLFWAVTVIDCPREIQGVRLSVGSNGASSWWLNGDHVLTLEGDRRMVEDDGRSGRLTLHAGRNILRCAVINGPGLSDFCARFLDDEGRPVVEPLTLILPKK
jgi:hypothetical protein